MHAQVGMKRHVWCAAELAHVVAPFIVVVGRFVLFAACKDEVRAWWWQLGVQKKADVRCSFYYARNTVGVVATAVNGGSTLRAAVASRMRNQRQRCGCFDECIVMYSRK